MRALWLAAALVTSVGVLYGSSDRWTLSTVLLVVCFLVAFVVDNLAPERDS